MVLIEELGMTTVRSNFDAIANASAEYGVCRLDADIAEDVYRSSELNARNELSTASSWALHCN